MKTVAKRKGRKGRPRKPAPALTKRCPSFALPLPFLPFLPERLPFLPFAKRAEEGQAFPYSRKGCSPLPFLPFQNGPWAVTPLART